MSFGRIVRRSVFALSIVSTLVTSPLGVPAAQNSPQIQVGSSPLTVQLFRTTITLSHPTDRHRLDQLGIKVLSEGTATATVLVDDEQLATLAQLRFEPHGSDEFNSLVNGQTTSGLRRPQVTNFSTLMGVTSAVNTKAATGQLSRADALSSLRASVNALAPEQVAAISGMTSIDSDGDGLTDTEEQWWCTDPLDANTRGDMLHTDKDYVNRLEQYLWHPDLGDHRLGAPFQGWAPSTTNFNHPERHFACVSSDGSVPDGVKRLLGLNVNSPSTAHDRFNDAIKLFGIDKTGATMPAYVLDPGKHPFVTAYPLPEVHLVQSSFVVQAVTSIQTDHTVSNNEQHSYSTAKTSGTSTSFADTVTWNDWQEATNTTPLAVSAYLSSRSANTKAPASLTAILSTIQAVTSLVSEPINCGYLELQGLQSGCGKIYDRRSEINASLDAAKRDTYWNPNQAVWKNVLNIGKCSVIGLICGIQFAGSFLKNNHEQILAKLARDAKAPPSGGDAGNGLDYDPLNNRVIVQPTYQISYPTVRQQPTHSETKGTSQGGAQTTTHTQYEENTVTNGQQFGTAQGWTNSTAVNTAHAADFWFAYSVGNGGTDYMTSLCNLAFNVYIGDDPNPAYTYFVSPDLGGDGCFHNYQPGDQRTFSAHTQSHAIPLTLDQMKKIDLGAPVNVVVADYSFGSDQQTYANARSANVLVAIKDDSQGSSSPMQTFLIPTFGISDTMQDVMGRYFPSEQDITGNFIAIWTPTNTGGSIPPGCVEPRHDSLSPQVWCKHALSTADWWNIYLNNLGDGTSQLSQTPAVPNSTALFRFNRDSDLDGYSDATEIALGTDPFNPASHPKPELIAGANKQPVINGVVTGTISLLNTGLYDAYGVEIIAIAPDDSISILNNTVGGSGRVRAGKSVVVGSSIKLPQPLPGLWGQSGHAQPAVGGYFTGGDHRIYTFTTICGNPGGCSVATGTLGLNWSDGMVSGTLNLGTGYTSPSPVDVGLNGVKLSMVSGIVNNNEVFTVTAQPPLDTFSYRINREPHTDPEFIASYNDPQGNHRFIIPPNAANLSSPTDNLVAFSGQMLQNPGVEIVTTAAFTATQPQTVTVVANNPSGVTITNAHLFLEFVNITGTVAAEFAVTQTLAAGPNVVNVPWNTNVFSPTFSTGEPYIVMVFFTDYQGNILDTAGRPLSSFQTDPKPVFAMTTADQDWNFGTAMQGTLLKRTFTFGNVGLLDLLTYINGVSGLSLSQTGSRVVGPADTTTYEMALNTSSVAVGPYDQTITIRSSDASQPTQTVRIRGMVTAGASDVAGGFFRPLDVDVNVTGTQTQGTWWTYTHTLGPNPDSLHPVKVYDSAYSQLWGVGKYATDFAAGTAPSDMFGDGRDGELVVSGTIDPNPIRASASGSQGSYVLSVWNLTGSGFVTGTLLMIHQSRGTIAGQWELNQIQSIASGQLTLVKPLANSYSTGAGASRAQAIWVPQYRNITIQTGGTVSTANWDGYTGGIIAMLGDATTTISGTINLTGKGFRGDKVNGSYNVTTGQGEGTSGDGGTRSNAPNGNGGGGSNAFSQPWDNGSSGAGGGNGTAGQPGTSFRTAGAGGLVAGNDQFTSMVFGGGGAHGSDDGTGGGAVYGLNGGGIVLLSTSSLSERNDIGRLRTGTLWG